MNISDVYSDRLDVERLGRMQTTASERRLYGLRPDDIVLDRSSVKLSGVGYPTVFHGCDEPVVFCGFTIRFRPHATVQSRFLCLQMRSEQFRIALFRVATVSANVNVNQKSLRELHVVLPSAREQVAIEQGMVSAEARMSDEEATLVKLRALKNGLLHDLLTGRVRVTAEAEATA